MRNVPSGSLRAPDGTAGAALTGALVRGLGAAAFPPDRDRVVV